VFSLRVIKLPKNTDKDWEYYGAVAPYFGVLSDERFSPANLSEAALEDFFASGVEHIDEVFDVIEKNIEPGFTPARSLDFGCGVGRIVLPLARRSGHVVGVDVSPGMLEEARLNSKKYGISNVEFVESDETLSKVSGTFDFVHSYIVMQHISTRRGVRFLARLLELLNPGGLGALHFTYSWQGWLQQASRGARFVRWLRESVPGGQGLMNLAKGRRFDHPNMLMNTYDVNRLFSMLQEHGCRAVHVKFTDHNGHWGVMLVFQK